MNVTPVDHNYCAHEPPMKIPKITQDIVPQPQPSDISQDMNIPLIEDNISVEDCLTKIRDLEDKNKSMSDEIKSLKEFCESFNCDNDLLQELIDLYKRKQNKSTRRKSFNAAIQRFSLTMSTYSPKAYRYSFNPTS